eukprot:TRINITY_DN780_c0_g1_i1.p1 TRINITY_DN780_c0_g1~~TRINITY_DN780_c0_g1_i1.p1  ORF type:complete len:243 (-),score=38.11 TRINITY_DN780_c0_g1_i1:96-824(-)
MGITHSTAGVISTQPHQPEHEVHKPRVSIRSLSQSKIARSASHSRIRLSSRSSSIRSLSQCKISRSASQTNVIASQPQKFTIVFLGEDHVGKTAVIERFVRDAFKEEMESTSDTTSVIHTMNINDVPVKLQIYDTPGQSLMRETNINYIRMADAVILVYNITRQFTFVELDYWRKKVGRDTKMMIIGNMSDLVEQREVDEENASDYATKYGIPFFETSAATGANVSEAFIKMASDLILSRRD